MILKHRDTEVLRFDWETSSGVKNVELNPAAERFLPLAFRDKVRKDPASLRYELELKFAWPDNRLEVSQYFLRNRIEKIIRYREKADRYLKVGVKDVTINPTITDNMLKRATVAEDLRRELKATLKSFPKASMEKLAILFKTSTRTIARHIKALQEAGELRRVGSRKTGHWQVIDSPSVKG